MKCAQCAEVKPQDYFREYPNGKGRYRRCYACETVNARYKYLIRKELKTTKDEEDIAAIETLYTKQREAGLEPPDFGSGKVGRPSKTKVSELITKIPEVAVLDNAVVPAELTEWLTQPLDSYVPEELQDVIYPALAKKYRPVLRVDGVPIYDEKYRDVLNQILKRFDDYEEAQNE